MNAKPHSTDAGAPRRSVLSWFGAGRKPAPTNPVAESEPEPVIPADARRILVVDDDEVVRQATALKLQKHGYAVVTAADGPAAIQAARTVRPDLILLDLSFPPEVNVAWDGFSIMGWLRRLEQTREIPIVIMTSTQGIGVYERARGAGAAGFFHKPLDFTPLLSFIDLWLKGVILKPARAGQIAKT